MGRLLSNLGLVAAVTVATLPGALHAQEADEPGDDESWFEIEVEVEPERDHEPDLSPYEDDSTAVTPPRRDAVSESAAYAVKSAPSIAIVDASSTEEQLAERARAQALDDATAAFAAGSLIAFIGALALVGVATTDAESGGLDSRGEDDSDLVPGYIGAGLILAVGYAVALPPLTIILSTNGKTKGSAHIGPNGVGYSATF